MGFHTSFLKLLIAMEVGKAITCLSKVLIEMCLYKNACMEKFTISVSLLRASSRHKTFEATEESVTGKETALPVH